ncbi:MAG: radical SAM protein [Candidatus Omnitrophota bacterium]|nr:radical SAM protein [Candidatus Omnitrophota bacterium]
MQREIIPQVKRHWVRLTRGCNNRCLFCLDKEAHDGSVIPLEKIKADLQKGRGLGIRRVVLSGGEPTIHPDFFNIVNMARTLGYSHIQVITNGRMFAYQSFLKQAIESGVSEITFSLHGHNSRLHDQQTKVPGSFQQSLVALVNALKEKDLIVSVDIVINKINVMYLASILEFFINLGVYEFDLLQVIPFGQAWAKRDILFYDIQKSIKFLRKAFMLSKDPRLHIWTNRFPPQYLEGFEYLIQHPAKLYDEVGGRKDMFNNFLFKGKVMDCKGLRCRFCFLENFCKDLIELKKKNKILSHASPFCLGEINEPGYSGRPAVYVQNDQKNKDILKFLDFYIQHRYFLKSKRCKECKHMAGCAGMQCNYIRKHGFEVLSPIKAGLKKISIGDVKKNSPYKLLRLGSACNAGCLFCNVPPESYALKELSTKQAKLEIGRLTALDKELRLELDITGGEPTLRKDLSELIKYAHRKGVKIVQVQTNAIRLSDNDYLKKLKYAGLNKLFISLHSSVPGIHDKLVGLEGAFDMAIAGIRNSLELNIDVTLNPVITTQNYKELPEYIKFVHNKFPQIKNISLSVIQPRERALINKYLIPSYGIISPYIKKAVELAKKCDLMIFNPYCGVPLCIGGWHKYLSQCVEYTENTLRFNSRENNLNLGKIKGPNCVKCNLYNFCNGVWREYALIYSFSDLKPIEN